MKKNTIIKVILIACGLVLLIYICGGFGKRGIGEKTDKELLCAKWVMEDEEYDVFKNGSSSLEFFSDGTGVEDDNYGFEWTITDGKLKMSMGSLTTVLDYKFFDGDDELWLSDSKGKSRHYLREDKDE